MTPHPQYQVTTTPHPQIQMTHHIPIPDDTTTSTIPSAPPPAKPSSARQALLGKPDLEAVLDPQEKPDRRVRMASPGSLVLAAEKGPRGSVAPSLWGSLAFLGRWGPLARRETQEPLAHAEGRERKENEVAEARKRQAGTSGPRGRPKERKTSVAEDTTKASKAGKAGKRGNERPNGFQCSAEGQSGRSGCIGCGPPAPNSELYPLSCGSVEATAHTITSSGRDRTTRRNANDNRSQKVSRVLCKLLTSFAEHTAG
ncbi:hypothetical protein C7M84_003535 [Penaeus vannamei]|uniref:Uncharacterized protein n=1 Tax=Penaeus vannamei TaxID=6689 RepID=A0A3R7PXR3_PENVA|nr:hypothetical protein C7M84_003535 [Penaeus vannamei]